MLKSVLFYLLLFLSGCIYSQSPTFYFKHVTIGNGLSNNTINAISQDQYGQIWIGTQNGLNKFNGLKNTVYRSNVLDTTAISNTSILNILEDRNGYIWVGTLNGLNRYDPKKRIFKKYFRKVKSNTALKNSLIICSKLMPDQTIWFGTGNGISIYNPESDSFKNILSDKLTLKRRNIVNQIYVDSNNAIWLATPNGLLRLNKTKSNNYTTTLFNNTATVNKIYIKKIIEVKPGVLGIATKYNGYLTFNTKLQTFKRPLFNQIPSNVDVNDLEIDNDNNLWIATTNGVFIITPQDKMLSLKSNISSKTTLNQNFVKIIYKDSNGSMWLGTESAGINIWTKSNQNFVNIKNDNIDGNTANCIITDQDANIYYGTDTGTVNKISTAGNVTQLLKVPEEDKLLTYPIRAIALHNENILCVGTLNRGIFSYNLLSKKEEFDVFSKDLKQALKNSGVFDIKKENNNYWFATFGLGVVKYNVLTKKFTAIKKPIVTTNIIKTILIEKNGIVWAGGLGGFYKLTIDKEGAYKSISFLDKDKFARYHVTSLSKDHLNNLWVGTQAQGLFCYDGVNLKKIDLDKKYPIYTIYSILTGKSNIIWLSTERGIVKYNIETKETTIFEQKNIEISNGFRYNSGVKLGDDKFYFGSLNGITHFNSNSLVSDNYAPNTLLLDLKIQNKTVDVKTNAKILNKDILYTKEINLDYKNSNFSITYGLPNYIHVAGNSYAYRLKGLDDHWVYTNQTEAFFTLQKAGNYTFEVKGANHNGVWSKNTTTLNITIKPKPWKTWWAYLIYTLIAICILLSVYWVLQSKSKLKYKLELEHVENKRIEELNNDKLEFFTNISHEFRTPLTLILGPLQSILSNYTGNKDTFNKLKIMEGSTNHLLRLINRLMDFRKFENNQFKLEAAEGNIVKFLKEIFLSFSEFAKIDNYQYEFETEKENLLVYYDRYKLERVFYNIISNAFRYTEKGGRIKVRIHQDDTHVIINVIDNGVGIAEEYLDKIFDRFFEVSIHNQSENNYQKGTGIGLSIAHNIVKLHKGEIDVFKAIPTGSRFVVKLKKGKGHLAKEEIIDDFKTSDDLSQYVKQISPKKQQENLDIESLLNTEKAYTILVVEDSTTLRSFIKEILKSEYNVIEAENGEVALELAIKHVPDLIISDVIMPKMVGTELCAKIKTNFKTSHIPVIMLTSRSSLVYKFQGLESGADDYLSKPFEIKELTLKVKNILESKTRLKENLLSKDGFTVSDVSLTSIDEKMLQKAYQIVKLNIANQSFNVNQFSEDLGVSRSMLFVKIKAWANVTPKDFIQEIRLKQAARLLEIDKFTVAEVSAKVGFKRQKYFSQCFQKKYNLTPTQYAQKFNANI